MKSKYMYISGILLVHFIRSLDGQLTSDYHQVTRLNCHLNGQNTMFIDNEDSSLRSLSILSPCHPEDYYRNCTFQSVCYVKTRNIQPSLWIGFYLNYSSVPESTDTMQVLTYEPQQTVKFSRQISSLSSNKLFYSETIAGSDVAVAFVRYLNPNGVVPTNNAAAYNFQVDVKMAYVMGRDEQIEAVAGGYIVSHGNFDEGQRYYEDGKIETLTLVGLVSTNTVRLTFLHFSLTTYDGMLCDDYLRISGLRGYWRDDSSTWECGDKEAGTTVDLLPLTDRVSFEFVTRRGAGNSSGFLLQYEVLNSVCPPKLAHSLQPVPTASDNLYRIECEDGYGTDTSTTVQTVDCSADWRSSIKACLRIPDPDECPPPIAHSKPAELSALHQYKVECLSGYWTSKQTATLTIDCSDPNWKSSYLHCIPQSQTPGTVNSKQTTQGTTARNNRKEQPQGTTLRSSDDSMLPIYIGAGVAAFLVIIIIIIVICILARKKKERNTDTKEKVVDFQTSSSEGNERETNRGKDYPFIDEELKHSVTNSSAGVYELADSEDAYENTDAIDRFDTEKDTSDQYSSVLAAKKKPKPADEATTVMIDNDLYES